MFLQVARNIYDAARCASCVKPRQQRLRRIVRQQRCDRDSRFRACLAFAVAGMAHHAGQSPRDHVRGLQVGLGKDHDDRAVVLHGAEIHLPHQAADDPRAVELRAGMFGIEGKARDRQSAAALLRLIDGAGEIALECFRREQAGSGVDQALGVDRTSASGSNALRRRAGGSAAARSPPRARVRRGSSRGSADRMQGSRSEPVTTTGRWRKRASSASTVRKASTTRALKPSADDDAVDVADVEMLRRGFDRERADDAGALAERNR